MTILLVDHLSLIMAALIVVVASVVAIFSRRYMDGDVNYRSFFVKMTGLSLAALLLVFANHVIVFIVAWILMGAVLAYLIGHNVAWRQARIAKATALSHFAFGWVCLAAAFGVLVSFTQSWYLSDILPQIGTLPVFWMIVSGGLVIVAAMVQSALWPFHKWLLTSMTAPTPVSAFMHAGIVNAGGFLVMRFAPAYAAMPSLLTVLFVLGAISAIWGGLWMMTRHDIKRSLGCSTMAQMGFMMMQCGLGLYTAALAHLVLHGFYKAYQFLGAGSAIQRQMRPDVMQKGQMLETSSASCSKICGGFMNGLFAVVGFVVGFVVAMGLFATFTNKSLFFTDWDSGAVLTIFAGFAGAQAMYSFATMTHLSIWVRALMALVIVVVGTVSYALIFNAFTMLLPINMTYDLSIVHVAVVIVFAVLWGGLRLRQSKQNAALYMRALNGAALSPAAIMNDRRDLNA